MSEQQQFHFTGKYGLKLFARSWHPDIQAKAVIILVHGYAEHSGRYQHVADFFTSNQLAVYALDHQGCGKSQGIKGYVRHFENYLEDLKTFVDLVRRREESLKLFLLGHSMGGGLAILYAASYPFAINGLITSAALVKNRLEPSPLVRTMAPLLARFVPLLGVQDMDINLLSRDPNVVRAFKRDPLNYNGKIKSRLGYEMLRIMKQMPEIIPTVSLPLLVLHGKADKLSSPQGSQYLYDNASSQDKTIHFFDNLYHELLNEPEKEEVLQTIQKWIDLRG